MSKRLDYREPVNSDPGRLAMLGMTSRAIAELYGITEGQAQYRIKQLKVMEERRQFRNGSSRLFKEIINDRGIQKKAYSELHRKLKEAKLLQNSRSELKGIAYHKEKVR